MRCVNIDWLEVYVLESADRYPMNADYFRSHGYFVQEREYGTRTYREMFTIEDQYGERWIEVRRNPVGGEQIMNGIMPESCHLRLVNRQCYDNQCVQRLCDFLAQHNYLFKRIYRIDICYDFIKFDSGDLPARFAQRYVEKKFRKINQCHLRTDSQDNWNDFEWETLSWGSPSSMVSTKMYNKTKELSSVKRDKPYIRQAWFLAGLIDDPVRCTVRMDGKPVSAEVWRIEFSLKSKADHWLIIESQAGKRQQKKAVEHRLSMFDSRDKLWLRFEELAFHYFRFKYREFKTGADGKPTDELQRKDLCRDKVLFKFNTDREFYQVKQLSSERKPSSMERILKQRLNEFRMTQIARPDAVKAIDLLIEIIDRRELSILTAHNSAYEIEAWQRAIGLRWGKPLDASFFELMETIKDDLIHKRIF